ncbi:MAG: hypothetical protein FWC13_11945 [Oscillospiraceae bacterium]|nr:hypothetical protein [Oscillospiraceae bacterium]
MEKLSFVEKAKNAVKLFLFRVFRSLIIATIVILVVSVVTVVVTHFIRGQLSTSYAITANYIVGALIIALGVFSLGSPLSRTGGARSAAVDAKIFNLVNKNIKDRESGASKLLFLGFSISLLTGIIDLIMGIFM